MKEQRYQLLTLEQSIEIQECLSHGMTFKGIAKRIGKNQATVSREVKRHLVVRVSSVTRTTKDGTPLHEPCPYLHKPPLVCNPCKRYHRACAFDKYVYSNTNAHKTYESELRTSREGIPLNKVQPGCTTWVEMDTVTGRIGGKTKSNAI